MTSGNRSSFHGNVTMEAEEKPTVHPCSIKQALKESPPHCLQASSSNGLAIAEASKKEESIINSTEDNVDDDYLDSFPPGYRFCPLDEELVLYYLKKKVMNEPLPQNRIMEVNLYRHNPEKLAEQYQQYGEKEWYFFTPRDKKYRNGTRPNRAAGDGYWKATGADREIRFKGHIVGYRKALVFYRGKPPKGDKTSWIMHEYRVNDPPPCKRVYNDMRLDDWVLCRIYKKVDKSVRTQSKHEYRSSPLIHSEDTNESTNLDYDYNNVADMMDYSNTIDSLMMHQSFPEGSLINFQHTVNDQILTSLPMKYSNENDRVEQDEIWSVANLDFASQLDFYNGTYVEPLINIDNILSVDTENKISPNPRMNGRG